MGGTMDIFQVTEGGHHGRDHGYLQVTEGGHHGRHHGYLPSDRGRVPWAGPWISSSDP